MVDDKVYLTTEEVADLLAVHVETVRRWRRENDGPPYHQLTPRTIRYDKEEVLKWVKQQK